MRVPEAFRSLARKAVKSGWRIMRTRNHIRWESPDGEVIITSGSPSDSHAARNARAQLRRAGLKEG